ncbi:DUF4180 domain-containing protein, partial [Bittarella massiliensis (ex Durand et al. 2017)]
MEKFVQYRVQVAIWGDHSGGAGKALRDFMRESNRGRAAFFADSGEGAPVQTGIAHLGEIERLSLPKQKSHPSGWLFCDWEGLSGRHPFSLVFQALERGPANGLRLLGGIGLAKALLWHLLRKPAAALSLVFQALERGPANGLRLLGGIGLAKALLWHLLRKPAAALSLV